MRHSNKSPFVLLVSTVLALATPCATRAQSTVDGQQVFLAQVQSDERAIMLDAMDLDDAQVAAFTGLYDSFQVDHKKIMNRAVALIGRFAADYDSMSDHAAERLLADWFELKSDEDRLIREYARKMGRVLPPTKVLRFVQIENSLSATLRLAALRDVPLAK